MRGWRCRLECRGVVSPAAKDGTGAGSSGGVYSPAGTADRIGDAGVPLEGVSKKIIVGAKWIEHRDVAAEQELQVLTAAIKLLPEEISACTDAEVAEAVRIVEEKIKRIEFLVQAWHSLMKRAAS